MIAGILIGIFVLFSYSATASHLQIIPPFSINGEMKDSLSWLQNNSPDIGIDYYQIYNKETFNYPNKTYTILNWWGYGHYITALSKRMPIATPLQDSGAYASSAFYLAHNETLAENMIAPYNPGYILVNNKLYELYPMIHSWVRNSEIKTDQVKKLYQIKDTKNSVPIVLNGMTDSFFESMMIRLFQFDGSAIYAEERIMSPLSKYQMVMWKSSDHRIE